MQEKGEGYTIESEDEGCAAVTTVRITTADGAARLGKPIGVYVTIRSKRLRSVNEAVSAVLTDILAERIKRMLTIGEQDLVLVVGLGNRDVPGDTLGSLVARRVMVTRQIAGEMGGLVRPVAAFVPGVMGVTGIDTSEIVRAVCERVRPALVIAVDALAAHAIDNLNAAIQVTDSGVSPGSAMAGGVKRGAINEASLGVPVIAIGMPVVIDAVTLAEEIWRVERGGAREGCLSRKEVLDMYDISFVAPKEADAYIDDASRIIAAAIDMALHTGWAAGGPR